MSSALESNNAVNHLKQTYFTYKVLSNPRVVTNRWNSPTGESREMAVFRYCVSCGENGFTDNAWKNVGVEEIDGSSYHCDDCLGKLIAFLKGFNYGEGPSRAQLWSTVINERYKPI